MLSKKISSTHNTSEKQNICLELRATVLQSAINKFLTKTTQDEKLTQELNSLKSVLTDILTLLPKLTSVNQKTNYSDNVTLIYERVETLKELFSRAIKIKQKQSELLNALYNLETPDAINAGDEVLGTTEFDWDSALRIAKTIPEEENIYLNVLKSKGPRGKSIIAIALNKIALRYNHLVEVIQDPTADEKFYHTDLPNINKLFRSLNKEQRLEVCLESGYSQDDLRAWDLQSILEQRN